MTSLLSQIAALVARRPRIATLARGPRDRRRSSAAAIAVGGSFKDDFTVPGIESQKAQDLLEQRFPAQSGTQATLVFSADEQLDERAIDAALAKIERQPHVVSVDEAPASPMTVASPTRPSATTRPRPTLDAAARERLEDATAGLPERACTSRCPASRSTAPPPAGSRSAR